jgi:hypothetical protein
VWRSLIDSGALVSNGTDVPVEDIDPLASFRASVTREMVNGQRFHPEQNMTRQEALASYTWNNAYAGFEASAISPALADFVVLDRDIAVLTPSSLGAGAHGMAGASLQSRALNERQHGRDRARRIFFVGHMPRARRTRPGDCRG